MASLLGDRLRRLSLLGALVAGCSAQSGELADLGGGGAGGTGGHSANGPTGVEFQDGSPLVALPGETRTVRVVARPPGVHALRFSLHGASLDAALDRSDVETDEDGTAEVVLSTPTKPTTFALRVSAPSGISTERPVSVSASGFGTIQILPSYSGKRPISYWVGSVVTGTTCADLVGVPPPDGPLTATALADGGPRIESVPSGPLLAVTVRAGRYAGGCKDVTAISPDSITTVPVSVVDRPLQLDETRLHVRLGVDSLDPGWKAAVDDAIGALFSSARGEASTEVAALLDEMGANLPAASPSTFERARALGGWDQIVEDRLGSASALTDAAAPWIREGLSALSGPEALEGTLASAGKLGGQALLELGAVAGLVPEDAGFSASNAHLSWTAEPGDSVLLGGTLFWLPSAFFTAAAEPVARSATGRTSMADALATALDCARLGEDLAASTAAAQVPACDAACFSSACAASLEALWDRARAASATNAEVGSLEVAVAGVAAIDDEARPTGFSGSWVGTLGVGYARLAVGGSAMAESPSPK